MGERAERALIVVPTYNEAANLPTLVPQALDQDSRLEILVVDDNSPDGTGVIADETARTNPRVHVMHRDGKRGLGTAYIAGARIECYRRATLKEFALISTGRPFRPADVDGPLFNLKNLCALSASQPHLSLRNGDPVSMLST